MRLLHVCLRDNRKGGLGAAMLILALLAIGGTFFIVLSNDYVTVEARIHDTDWSKDPIITHLDVRVTNKFDADLVVDRMVVVVWADQARTIMLSSATVEGFPVPAHTQRTTSLTLEVRNADAFGGTVWVDVDATWTHGGTVHHEEVAGKEISVGAALASL